MSQLYITFFVIGVLVFAAIVLYSWLKQSNQTLFKDSLRRLKKNNLEDPLFTDDLAKNIKPNSKQTVKEALKEPFLGNQTSASNTAPKQTDKLTQEADGQLKPSVNANKNKAIELTLENKKAKSLDEAADKVNVNHTSLPVVEMQEPHKPTTVDDRVADNVEIINVEPKRDSSSSSIVTELVARVKNKTPLEQKDLLVVFRKHDYKFHCNIHLYGLNQLTDLWRDVEYELPSARFVELGIAIQLADRDGAMTQKELHDFQQMALEFSNSFDAPFEFSMDIDEALVQAKVLDQIGRRYDSMAVLNVVPRSKTGFRVADIESCARDLGMARNKKGVFLKTTGQKNQISVLYRLACTNSTGDFGLSVDSSEAVHDLVMYMNVPATKNPEVMFQDMVKDTNDLATWLDGKVVDRDGNVMTQRSYAVLTQQISDIAFSMQQDGLMPGDEFSKKLF